MLLWEMYMVSPWCAKLNKAGSLSSIGSPVHLTL